MIKSGVSHIEALFMSGYRYSSQRKKRSTQSDISAFLEWGTFSAFAVRQNRRVKINFSSNFPNQNLWKIGYGLWSLREQVISGGEIINPYDTGYFDVSSTLYNGMEKITDKAQRYAIANVPKNILTRFKKTSKIVGRKLMLS